MGQELVVVGLRFNPPPGWPAAPEGFIPEPGWQPDPSWPPPPPGWQLWLLDDQPPGQAWTPPGQAWTPPGQAGPSAATTTPGQAWMPPGQAEPSAATTPPGQGWPSAATTPGQGWQALPGYGTGRPDVGVGPPAGTSGWAIASFVVGLLSVALLGLATLLSITFGIIALRRIRRLGQKGRGLAIAGLVLSAAWLVVAIVVVIAIGAGGATRSPSTGKIVSRGHLSAFSLATGDCFNNPAGARSVSSVTALPCTQPHNAQVFAKFKLTGSAFSYPGTTTVVRLAREGCNARTGSINRAKTTSVMTTGILFPLREDWIAGRRTVSCLVVNPTADLTSSLLNSQPAG